MNVALKTKAEQRMELLSGLGRPLTAEESDELRKAMHAVYCRDWRMERERKALRQHRAEELVLLAKLRKEASMPERLR